MTRIVGSMVMRNEVDRYLADCISWASGFLDEIFVYDDRSDDGSAELAVRLGCRTVRRGDGVPSFIENEGAFRQGAWNSLEKVMELKSGDWVFSFDADEFMVAKGDASIRQSLQTSIDRATQQRCSGVLLPFPEVFAVEDGVPMVRKDGYWGKIVGSRLFEYRPRGVFKDKKMGCGSEPTYVAASRLSANNFGLHVLHYGYAKKEDQVAKYERYSSLAAHGHSDSHINSIVQRPTLERWSGPTPEVRV